MSSPKKQKIRILRSAKPATDQHSSLANSHLPNSYFDVSYFDVRPALLTYRAEGLKALTKAGVRGFPEADDAEELLAFTMRRHKVRGNVLDLSAMGGLIGSLPGVTLQAVESSAAALAALKAGQLDAHAAAIGDDLSVFWPVRAKTVAMVLAGDRGNAYAQAQIAWAHASTPAGGTLYLAGDKDKGFDRYVRMASAAFGTGETIAREDGMRVAKLVRRPGHTPPYPATEYYEAFGVKVVGLAGVFSAAKPDKATSLMLTELENLPLEGKDVLDLGCGTGIIGAWAASKGANVTLIDGDLQSVRSAQATLQENSFTGEVIHSDVDAALTDQQYDVIFTNPPFHVGRGTVLDVALEFIAAAARRLRIGGVLYLVANEPLPYEKAIQAIGEPRELVRASGFKLLEATRH